MSQLNSLIYERIKVRLEEYKTLRTEVLQRLQTGTTLINISIVIVTGLLSLNGLLLSKINTDQITQEVILACLGLTFGLFIPVTFLVCGSLIRYNDQVVERLGEYSAHLEDNINSEFDLILQSINDSTTEKLKPKLKSISNIKVLEWVTSIQNSKSQGKFIGFLFTLALSCFNFAITSSLLTLISFLVLYYSSLLGNEALFISGLAVFICVLSLIVRKRLCKAVTLPKRLVDS